MVTGGAGIFVFLTERGVANEIKGFVLLLIAAVLLIGGCVLRELSAIRRPGAERLLIVDIATRAQRLL